ncbi:hypothetical protein Leryth_023348 [Lithospermum erythrorhizon]|nr:hypothetical protein Leryth_023348 [Lithospermum erythrorhizon]
MIDSSLCRHRPYVVFFTLLKKLRYEMMNSSKKCKHYRDVLNQMKIYSSVFACFIFIGILSEVCIAIDTLTISQPLAINETLISQRGRFCFGFSPEF